MSSTSAAGALCAKRIALTPISFSWRRRNSQIESGTATPTPAWSWWIATPCSFSGWSLRKKPLSASKRMLRKPVCTSVRSSSWPRRRAARRARGTAFGCSSDHSARVAHRQRQPRAGRLQRAHPHARAAARHFAACGVEQRHVEHAAGARPSALLASVTATGSVQRPSFLHRVGMQPVGGDVQRVALDEPGVAVDAGAFVPPAFLRVGVDPHGDRVHVVAVAQVGRDVDGAAVVARPVAVDDDAVDPHRAVRGDRVELQLDVAAAVGLGQLQVAPVPADAARAVALRGVLVAVERAFDRPVVRQVEAAPGRVVEVGGRRAPGAVGLAVVVAHAVALDRRQSARRRGGTASPRRATGARGRPPRRWRGRGRARPAGRRPASRPTSDPRPSPDAPFERRGRRLSRAELVADLQAPVAQRAFGRRGRCSALPSRLHRAACGDAAGRRGHRERRRWRRRPARTRAASRRRRSRSRAASVSAPQGSTVPGAHVQRQAEEVVRLAVPAAARLRLSPLSRCVQAAVPGR